MYIFCTIIVQTINNKSRSHSTLHGKNNLENLKLYMVHWILAVIIPFWKRTTSIKYPWLQHKNNNTHPPLLYLLWRSQQSSEKTYNSLIRTVSCNGPEQCGRRKLHASYIQDVNTRILYDPLYIHQTPLPSSYSQTWSKTMTGFPITLPLWPSKEWIHLNPQLNVR